MQFLADDHCPHPGVPIAGYIVNGNNLRLSVNSTVVFACNRGYVMEGDSMQTCLEFRQWSGNGAPLCKGS